MESKKINQLATELAPELSDLTIIGDPTTGISKKITLSQMASLFTGTVEEYPNLASFPLVGTVDTIYIALDTNIIYRWNTGTSAYVELSPNIVTSLVFNDANGFDGTISLVGSTATLTITTALTQGSIGFIGASGALTQDNSNFFWDNTNKRLGINTNAPTTAIDAFGSGIIGRLNGTSTNNAFLGFASAGSNKWSIGNVQSDHRFRIYNEATTSELVSVLQTGEVGIGVANPLTKLHIFGGASALIANLDANTSVAKSISFRSGNSSRINLEVSGTESGSNAGMDLFIRTYTDAGALLATPFTILRSSGNIGINTNNPLTLLHLGGATNKSIRIDSANGNGAYFGSFQNQTILSANRNPSTGTFTDTSKAAAFIALNANAADGNIVFATTTSNNTEPTARLTISSTGLVGINTTNLVFQLDVETTNLSVSRFYSNATGKRNNILIQNSSNFNYGVIGVVSGTGSSNGDVYGLGYSASGSTAFTNVLNWTSVGNVGIGTNVAPAVNGLGLAIYASDYPRITLRNSTSGDTTGDGLQIAMVGANVQYDLAENGYQMWTTGGTERMRIQSDGAILSGTTNDGFFNGSVQGVGLFGNNGFIAASRNGSIPGFFNRYSSTGELIQFRYAGSAVGNISTNGSTTAYNTSPSDFRLKINIEDWNENIIEGFKNADPKLFHFNYQKNTDEKTKGFIAQDLYKYFPEAYPFDENGYHQFNPSGMVIYLMKAIKEQQQQIEELKSLINK